MAAPRNATSQQQQQQQQQHMEKFYKGSHSDTPWNKDLLWRYHVSKENKQEKVNLGERLPNDAALQRRQERMVMGITGTLIPDITPRLNHNQHTVERRLLVSSSSARRLMLSDSASDAQSTVSRARSRKTESVCSHSASSTCLSTSSSNPSLRSMRLQDVQELLASQSRMLSAKTDEELSGMRHALQEEARKREEAERKIHFLCEKLGIQE